MRSNARSLTMVLGGVLALPAAAADRGEAPSNRVRAEGVRLREAPDRAAPVLRRLHRGDRVQRLSPGDGTWCKVGVGAAVGYVACDLLEGSARSASGDEPSAEALVDPAPPDAASRDDVRGGPVPGTSAPSGAFGGPRPAADDELGLFVKVFTSVPGLSLGLKGKGGEEVSFEPNTVMALGLAVDYQGLGGGFSMRVGEPQADPERYGRTEYTDFQFHYHRDSVALDLYYQRYRGFHLEAAAAGCEPGEPCGGRPELEVAHIGASGFYVFDTGWSLKAAFEQTQRQRRSAGSWLLGGAFSYVSAENDGPLLPAEPDLSERARALASLGFAVGTVTGGYGHTFVSDGHWFFSPVVLVGMGLAYGSTAGEGGEPRSETSFGGRATVRLAGGYNGPTWTFGVNGFGDGPFVMLEEVEISWLALQVDLYVGARF